MDITDRLTVLIVDDDKFIRNQVSNLITSIGFECEAFSNGETALKHISQNDTNLIITDIYMEEINGIDLIEKIKEMNLDIPVIVMTGDESIDIEREVRGKGVFAFFQKPLELEIMKQTIMAALKIN